MVSFRGFEAPDWILDGIRNGSIPAVCLFAYNVASLAQLRDLNLALRDAAASGGLPPPIIGIDQEGGQLMAVTGGATELPGNMALGATRSAELAHAAGRILGLELLALGCNLNFAPVLDLATRPENNVVGLRAFSDSAGLVSELGAAQLRGLQETGLLATIKHFPGHGDTELDSHHVTPQINLTLAEMLAHELLPFRAAIAADAAALITAHVLYPQLDDQPATHSAVILKDLLRGQLGFEGLVITDALDMQAIAGTSGFERSHKALQAGADLALLGHLPGQQQLVRQLAEVSDAESVARVAAVRAGLPRELPDLDTVGCAEHQAVAQRIADASVTLLRGCSATLGIRPDERLLLVSVLAGDLTPAETSSGIRLQLAQQLARRHAGTVELVLDYAADGAALRELLQAVDDYQPHKVVVATVNASSDPSQVTFLRELVRRGHDPAVVMLRSPLDAKSLPFVSTLLCTYGRRSVQTEAAARVLFGELQPTGRLPISLDLAESTGVSA
jgi:beta-N-acetylhexosaminidase